MNLEAKQQESMRLLLVNLRFDTLLKETDAMQKTWQELSKSAQKGVDEILTPKQRQRLQEISLQQRGGHALNDPDVAEALKLTPEQRQKIQAIQVEAAKEMKGQDMK